MRAQHAKNKTPHNNWGACKGEKSRTNTTHTQKKPVGESMSLIASAAFSARPSCSRPIATLMETTARMRPVSIHSCKPAVTTHATSSTQMSTLLSCAQSLARNDGFFGGVSALGPYLFLVFYLRLRAAPRLLSGGVSEWRRAVAAGVAAWQRGGGGFFGGSESTGTHFLIWLITAQETSLEQKRARAFACVRAWGGKKSRSAARSARTHNRLL